MDIIQIRKDTIGCENLVHLNNAGAALMPAAVASAIRDYITAEEMGGGYEVADKNRQELNTFYQYAAELMNCSSSNIYLYRPVQLTVITGHFLQFPF